MFGLVEGIRQTSVRFHRDEDETARRELEAMLNGLSPRQTTRIIRAFSYFSHLANIAEDLHHIRRTRAHALAGSAPREGTLAHALARAREAGIPPAQLRAFFADALVSPVLTAHPTEVRRKSTLNREVEIARLLTERERVRLTPEEQAASDEALRRAVLTLWQTSLLRRTKLTVLDEVENGISYYVSTFLRELPRLYAALEDTLATLDPAWNEAEVPSFLRMGSWIGGDRDGNPFVTADVLRQALRRQSARALSFYLEELHELGGELSLSSLNVGVSEPLQALADRSPDRSPHRQDEPYRRAISGIYARLAATARALDQPGGAAPRRGRRPALRRCRRAAGRARRARPLAQGERLGHPGARASARPAARGRRVRLPPGQPRSAPELRRARAHGRRAARGGLPGHRLCRPRRGGARRQAAGGARDGAAAGLALRGLFRGDELGAGDPQGRGAKRAGCTVRQRWPTASSPRPTASRTSWRWRCCSRRWGCCGRARARST